MNIRLAEGKKPQDMVVPSSYLRVPTRQEVLTKSKPSQEDFWLQVRAPTPRADMIFLLRILWILRCRYLGKKHTTELNTVRFPYAQSLLLEDRGESFPYFFGGLTLGKLLSLLDIEIFFPINSACLFFATVWKSVTCPPPCSMISKDYRFADNYNYPYFPLFSQCS